MSRDFKLPSKDKIFALAKQGQTIVLARSLREKVLIFGAVLVVIFFAALSIKDSISTAFASQSAEFEKLTQDIQTASVILSDYAVKRARVREIEKRFEGERFKEGIMSYLENLVINRAGVSRGSGFGTGFQIRELPVITLAGSYQLAQYDISLWTSDFPRFVDFLQAITEGDRPLIISGMKLRKQGTRMQAEIQISRIERKQKARAEDDESED